LKGCSSHTLKPPCRTHRGHRKLQKSVFFYTRLNVALPSTGLDWFCLGF